jgi:hypothetical protein
MNKSILKFNLNNKLQVPNLKPNGGIIPKGTSITITYPNENEDDVFFKYTLDNNIIPSYFSGNLYRSGLGIIIKENCILKVVSCKFGFRDSDILSVCYTVSEEGGREPTIITLPDENNNGDVIIRNTTKVEKGEISDLIFSNVNSPQNNIGMSDYRNSVYSANRNSVHSKNDDYEDPDAI